MTAPGTRSRVRAARPARLWGAAAFAITALTGCAVTPPTLEASEVCVSWIDFELSQDMFDNAEAVVLAEPHEVERRATLFGVEVGVYELAPNGVLKGDVGDGTIEVLSTPLTCQADGRRYPEDRDPLEVDDEVIVYLSSTEDGGWRTLSPYDAVEELPEDGTLPFLPGG